MSLTDYIPEMTSSNYIAWLAALIAVTHAAIYFLQYRQMKRQAGTTETELASMQKQVKQMKHQTKVLIDDNDVNYASALAEFLVRMGKWDSCQQEFVAFLDALEFFRPDNKDVEQAVANIRSRIGPRERSQHQQTEQADAPNG
jgi:hypothetical protein